jgi:acyl-CoA dehydrogenase
MHGGLGMSWELPLVDYMMSGHIMGIADGPSEVHKITIAKQVLSNYAAATDPMEIAFTRHNRIQKKKLAIEKVKPVLAAAGVDLKVRAGERAFI